MKLWTIHADYVWGKMQADGVLQGKAELADPLFANAYAWMQEQMIARIGAPPPGVSSPLWSWYQYDSVSKPRPDLRRSGHLPRGTNGVMLEVECAADDVLLSDFLAWHCVLNNWYYITNEAELAVYYALPASERQRYKRATWKCIFDLNFPDPDGYITSALPDERAIQATFWQLRLEQVTKVTLFVAR